MLLFKPLLAVRAQRRRSRERHKND